MSSDRRHPAEGSTESPPSAEAILEELAADPSVDPDVADATVVEEHTERVRRRRERVLTADDGSSSRSAIDPGTYRRVSSSRVAHADRYDQAPENLSTKRIEYIEQGRPVETCPKCSGSTRLTCPDCHGDLEVDCGTCHGSGESECSVCEGDPTRECDACDGTGEQPCSSCGGSASENCPECGGTGGHSEERQCPRCEGDGWIHCAECDGEDDDCDECGGDNSVDCPRCSGNGVEETWHDCPRCGGRESVGCTDCNGTGVERCSTCRGSTTLECTSCDGTGETECTNCEGSGIVDCTNCDDGEVTCSYCSGAGEVVHAVEGELSFGIGTTVDLETDRVPRDWIDTDDGTVTERTREDPETEGGVYRRVVEVEEIPVRTVTYAHLDNEYEVASVDGALRYDEAPQPAENLRAQVEAAVDSGFFEYDSGGSWGETVRRAPRTALGDAVHIAAGVAVTGAVLIGLAFATTFLPIGDAVQDAVGVGGAAVAALWYANRTGTSGTTIRTASNGGGLVAPALVGVAAGGVVAGALVRPAGQLLAVSLAAAFWANRVAERVMFEARRAGHRTDRREEFLYGELDGRASELRARGLDRLLPETEPTPSIGTLRRVRSAVFLLAWGPNVLLVTLLAVGEVGATNLLLQYVGFTTALAAVGATVLVSTASLAVLAWDSIAGGRSDGADRPVETAKLDRTGPSRSESASVQSRTSGPSASERTDEELGDFQLVLLYSVEHADGITGVEIQEAVRNLYDESVDTSSLYPALDELTRTKYLQSTNSGYVTTRAGDQLLHEEASRLESLLDERPVQRTPE
ncbi:hypothetical protein GRX01_03090 [Halobaculum sp. WSA2]|uniref:Uncharacterized protein n=1 Tax=Halobaculum saliterrae TaxID=2073113 RepID=A0A6B0SUG8_9EURY|nr:hypothetical protein [Halobaculum saliterrae]MXR40341.1 hypothetical protein [Halobaculum saliterrae]